jgi:hypothetical protein
MKYYFFTIGLLVSKITVTQIQLKQDHRIDLHLFQKKTKSLWGYRIQIAFDPDKKVVEEVRNRFVSNYPKIDSYMTFEAPYYNLMIGDFRTQIEAQSFAEKIQGAYTLNIVRKELINLPRVD